MEKKTILIVEDEKIIAEDIKNIIVNFNYNVPAIITNGEKAIQKAGELKPDLILMDIMIEGNINGIEAAKQIYSKFSIPVIFLTSYADEKIIEQAAKSSPFGYIIKPFEDRELRATIEIALYKSKMEIAFWKNRNFLLKVIDTVPNNIFVKDKDGKYLMVNKSVAELFNTIPKDMVGKTDRELIVQSMIKNENLDNLIKDDLEVIKKKKEVLIPEVSLSLDNGERIWFQTTKVPLILQDDSEAMLGVSVDITALKNSFLRLQDLMEETVNGLVSAVEKRDPYTAGHQRRVSLLANAIAVKMKLSKFQIDGLRIAAIVHDIGKINIPTEILSKPGKLSDQEFNLIKTHPQAGFEILSTISFPWPVAEIVLQHQERINGSGYPRGLKNNEILIEARIIAVADVVEAIMSHRPYRPSRGMDFALSEINLHKGVLYDEIVAETCLNLFKNKEFAFSDSNRNL